MVSRRVLGLSLATLALAACGGSPVPPQQSYGAIRGRVFDAATGAAVAGATVTVDQVLTATSGADGQYRIATVPPGQYTLSVAQPAAYRPPALNASLTSGSVQAGETATIDIPLTHT